MKDNVQQHELTFPNLNAKSMFSNLLSEFVGINHDVNNISVLS